MSNFDLDYDLEVLKRQFGVDEDESTQFDLHKLHSKYWMNNLPTSNVNLISLSSYRRAIAKFVKISTLSAGLDKPIKVRFNVKDSSFTDADKFVVISANIKNKEFDAAVGLALHEANHIIDTDTTASRRLLADPNVLAEYGETPLRLTDGLVKQMKRLDLMDKEAGVRQLANKLRNWIEDRRIDYNGQQRSPGYRPYYKATWDKYFGSKIVTLGLQSKYYREIDIPSYMFRIINITNPASDLKALPGLDKIYDMLDLENIKRLNSNYDSANLAMKVLGFVMSHFADPQPEEEQPQDGQGGEGDEQDEQQQPQGGGSDDQEQEELPDDMVDLDPDQAGAPGPSNDDENEDDETNDEQQGGGNSGDLFDDEDEIDDGQGNEDSEDDKENEDGGDDDAEGDESEDEDEDLSDDADSNGSDDESNDENDESNSEDGDENDDEKDGELDDEEDEEEEEPIDLSRNQKRLLNDAMKDQDDYLNGETKKTQISERDNKLLDSIDKSGTTIEKVQGDARNGMNVMVVRDMNKDTLATLPIGYTGGYRNRGNGLMPYEYAAPGVERGIRLGKLLARKLQVRNETKIYKSKRKTSGKIDKRLLYSVGFGDTSIFEKTRVDEFGNAIVHISVDASGSMDGTEWTETMTSIVAIAYAASKVENLDVVISFRSTINIGVHSSRSESDTPLMVIAYDSRKDSFKKIQQLFPSIEPNGITPEGLCYEAVMDEILASANGKVGYFINFSDGMPNMTNGSNARATSSAPEIARVMVEKMRNVGIRILAFYIGGGYRLNTFQYMYGKDASSVSVTELIPLAKELNKLFSTEKR